MDERPGRRRAPRSRVRHLLPWLPTYSAVALMLGLLFFALVSLRPTEQRPSAPPVSVPATPPFLAGPAAPTSPAPAPRTEAVTRSPRTSAAAPTPAPPAVTGRYRVVDTFRDSFIGEVRVSNTASRSRTWTVLLRFRSADTLRAFWVEGAPRPTLARSGDTFTFTGTAPVAAGRAAPLRFHFDRDGPVPAPVTCSVNGTGCAIATPS